MAGASMKDIKTRIRSVQNTRQITKAMQLVASSKLRGAQLRMESSKPFFEAAQQTMKDIAAHRAVWEQPYFTAKTNVRKRCYVVIAGDRGLAGSHNTGIFKEVETTGNDAEKFIIPVGKKACERFGGKGIPKVDGIRYEDCEALASELQNRYLSGEFDEICIVYSRFFNVLYQKPTVLTLLPINAQDIPAIRTEMIFESGAGDVLGHLIPQYLSGLIYAIACESFLSEQAARRVAMDSATKNADEMIEDLSLRYNRARQGSITQEITEIVAGAEH